MKHLNIVSLSLLLLFVSFACSMNTSDGKLLFGEDFGLADYEEGSWEVKEDLLVALEDKVVWAPGTYENFELEFEFLNDCLLYRSGELDPQLGRDTDCR